MRVLYIPPHANGKRDHPACEFGVVSSVKEGENGQDVWVRYKGETGQKTPVKNLLIL